MRAGPDKLREDILTVFKQSCRQGRLDVAEHLLRALEVSCEQVDDDGMPSTRDSLADAYLTIARLRTTR